MVEAMACGTPVAALNGSGGPKDVIAHGVDGLLSDKATYTDTVLNHFKTGNRQAMETAARAKVVEAYSLEATYRVLKQSVTDALKQ